MTARTIAIALAAILLVVLTAPASACPSCYGQAQGPVIDGMNNAISAMIGIIGFVLSGFVVMFIAIGRRTRMTNSSATTGSTSSAVDDGNAINATNATNATNDRGVFQWKNS